jgi:DNA-binding response OmpR family regulator
MRPGTRVLLVEDDRSIAGFVEPELERLGFRVRCAYDGPSGLEEARHFRPELVILDIMLPKLDGVGVLKGLRREGSRVPVVMLTARDATLDKVHSLDLGADDYVTKPFEMPELVARVRALLRRSGAEPAEGTIAVGSLEIDPQGHAVRKGGEDISLSATEYRLLLELARRPGQVFTRELLLERVWNYEYLGDSRLVDVAVQRLRSKIEDDPAHPSLIRTVRGVGYRLERG